MTTTTITVVDQDRAEDAKYHVCVLSTPETRKRFPTGEFDVCCECGEEVLFKPGGPVLPKKICAECAIPLMNALAKKDSLEIAVSPDAAEILSKWQSEH